MMSWLNNQTNPTSIHNAGSTCLQLLNQVQDNIAQGKFQFEYACPKEVAHYNYTGYIVTVDDDSSWYNCQFNWNSENTNRYIGVDSIAYQICQVFANVQAAPKK